MRLSRRHLALLAFVLASAAWADVDFVKQPVRLVADNWCPQHCKDSTSQRGYVVDIVGAALDAEGIAYQVEYRPWVRALRETERGVFDGLLTPTETYTQFLHHQQAVGYQEYCLYARRDKDWNYRQPEDLFGRSLVYLKESGLGSLEEFIGRNKERIRVEEIAGGENIALNLFTMLDAGRADAIIITSDVYGYKRKQGIIADRFRELACLGPEKMIVGLSKAKPPRARALAAALDRGILKLRKSGRLREITDAYGIALWPANPKAKEK